MKKNVMCCLLCLSLAASPAAVYAENTETELQTEKSENIFSFRGIPWYSTKSAADAIFLEDGAEIKSAAFENYAYRLSGIDHISVSSSKDWVEGGGIMGRYVGLNVAGYDVSDTFASYIYTINEDGSINRSEEDAEFYFGWYTFDSKDFVDGEGIYDDLSQKLSSLYGEGLSDTEDDYYSTVTWYDEDNNQIRLLLGAKGEDNDYVTLGYIVSDADERLDEIQAALDAEAAAQEAEDRENNQDNVSGL